MINKKKMTLSLLIGTLYLIPLFVNWNDIELLRRFYFIIVIATCLTIYVYETYWKHDPEKYERHKDKNVMPGERAKGRFE